MSNENSIGTGVCRNADTDADEKRAWVRGASLGDTELVEFLESKERLLNCLAAIPAPFPAPFRFHRYSNDGYQPLAPQEESGYESGDESYDPLRPCDSGYVSLWPSPREPVAVGTSQKRYQMPVSEEQPASAEQPASDNSYPSGRGFTDPPIPDHDRRSSSRASPENESNEYFATLSPEDDWLNFAYAKHRMVVSLMRDFYAILDSQWSVGLRTRAGSEPAKTGTNPQDSSSSTPSANSRDSGSSTPSSALNGKKRRQDQDDDENKRKTSYPKSGMGDQRRLFACCFHKYNAPKYCSNSQTGTKYRSCAGPGFSKISQLKQHLKRNHRAPINCPRCWLVMESQAEMASHANTPNRCERKEPQVQEGVDQDKMRMIMDTWGVSWE